MLKLNLIVFLLWMASDLIDFMVEFSRIHRPFWAILSDFQPILKGNIKKCESIFTQNRLNRLCSTLSTTNPFIQSSQTRSHLSVLSTRNHQCQWSFHSLEIFPLITMITDNCSKVICNQIVYTIRGQFRNIERFFSSTI